MQAELATLAASGATALVGAMVSDAWLQARDRVARFLARGEDPQVAGEELETLRTELVAAHDAEDTEAAADIEDEWRLRLRRALRADPAAAEELRVLLAELAPQTAEPQAAVVNTISGGTYHGPVIQGDRFSQLTFHSSTATGPAGQSPDAR
ncbi:hypothetical protein [Streptomyces katsurahamanus]|uniref:CchlP n=1 Tax=Streptomyces katsurahamanus TaxID=2577098 RepID=A0ABW9NRF0_9ACTN|nr:hypothetical protein [Streptomyces katsurahamanus]MQS35818.1 hypothetical protein [Streptomyces katsurahamanus]